MLVPDEWELLAKGEKGFDDSEALSSILLSRR
jgi:hypothetical protein